LLHDEYVVTLLHDEYVVTLLHDEYVVTLLHDECALLQHEAARGAACAAGCCCLARARGAVCSGERVDQSVFHCRHHALCHTRYYYIRHHHKSIS
jgi:hypothetical protein